MPTWHSDGVSGSSFLGRIGTGVLLVRAGGIGGLGLLSGGLGLLSRCGRGRIGSNGGLHGITELVFLLLWATLGGSADGALLVTLTKSNLAVGVVQ